MGSLANSSVRTGFLVGAGAAVNVSLGWIPKRVDVHNITDGSVALTGFPAKLIQFNTAGPAVPTAGMKILGATSGATARIKDIFLVSGTYAGSNGAGYFVCDPEEIVGTFGTENVSYSTSAAVIADAAVVVQVDELGQYTTGSAGPVLSTAATTGLVAYAGDSTHAKGFTIGSTIAASAKRLRWTAFRD